MRASRAARRARLLERLDGARACGLCGYSELAALEPGEPVVCARCSASLDGRSAIELHHVAGRRNLPGTVAIGANPHRLLTDRQRDWPAVTLRNPKGSPTIACAGLLRGCADIAILCAAEVESDASLSDTVATFRPATIAVILRGFADLAVIVAFELERQDASEALGASEPAEAPDCSPSAPERPQRPNVQLSPPFLGGRSEVRT